MGKNGGKRPGAGRKSNAVKALAKRTAEEILAVVDEVSVWNQLIQSEDSRIQLDTMKYLTDRRDGKAAQTVENKHSSDADNPMKMRVEIVHIGSK